MTSRFKRQPSTMLEIRGISRGSLIDHNHIKTTSDLSPEENHYFNLNSHSQNTESDSDDESTIVDVAVGATTLPSPSHSHDTVTASDSSHYWSTENSFTTGNTTERSSVYSWGDHEFDLQTSRMVRRMFQAIERMLFEGVLSGSTSLQQECREWMEAFPHLRVLGKQILPSSEDGVRSIASSSRCTSFEKIESSLTSDILEIHGSSITPIKLPHQVLSSFENDNEVSSLSHGKSEVFHLYEEIFTKDGVVEEYLAYDIREMDDDEHKKKYHIPHRRRLGFPPITPNACLRDAILQQVFDVLWYHVVSYLYKPVEAKSLLTVLMENLTLTHKNNSCSTNNISLINKHTDNLIEDRLKLPLDGKTSHLFISNEYNDTENTFDRCNSDPYEHSRKDVHHLPYQIPFQSELPPSRGSYLDTSFPIGRSMHFSAGYRSSTPFMSNPTDINSLNEVIKISRKELQTRAERVVSDDVDVFHESATRFDDSASLHHRIPHQLMPVVASTGTSNRQFISRDFRQQSGHGRKGRGASRSRLLPLDRSKTPNMNHQNLNVTATKLVPGPIESPLIPYSGGRISSPPGVFQPPPTAPNPSTGLGGFWVNSVNARLPPITSSLESLPENSLSDFKKTRGKTAYTRISSALDDEKLSNKLYENVSRPNTTHTFRSENIYSKRPLSVTPIAFTGHSSAISPIKLSTPFLGSHLSSGIPIPHFSTASPEHFAGLAGITGKSITLNNFLHSSSPDDGSASVNVPWGFPLPSNPQARKK